ncbi:cation:proton antiporter, partial [Acinetobacter baumannii]
SVLMSVKKEVIALALFGTIISTFLVGTLMYFGLMLVNIPISYLFCLLFGAIISPTDPVAVLSILKNSKAPIDLEMK